MKYFRPIFSGILMLGFIYLLSISLKMGETSIPPIGSFLNPFSGFWQNADKTSLNDSAIFSEKLKADVDIHYDERNVPHIYAENLSDLIFGQGYAIAKERLWQMDITTRSIEGRSAEVLGNRSIKQDINIRRLGIVEGAKKAVQVWEQNPEGKEFLNSFCNGINHFINQLSPSDYPLEFKLLGYEPEEWTPFRTALFIKAMALTLNSRQMDIANSNALAVFGEEKFIDIDPEKNKKQSPIIQEKFWLDGYQSFVDDLHIYLEGVTQTEERIEADPFVGSNNFAISGEKTKSGNPILANDPHLKLSLPSIWIEMHLVSPEMNAYGVSLPGMPGITLGFNEDIAWGQTNAGHDVFDIYRVKWTDDTKTKYIVDEKELETEVKVEEFNVKGGSIVSDTVLYTIWGPIKKENDQHTDLAQYWISNLAPTENEIMIYLNINKAKDYTAFKTALEAFSTPAQNFIYGAKNGDIAMTYAGKIPHKKDQQGRFIQDGSLSKNKWQGYVPFEEQPFEINPERNFVASANQHTTDASYPYYYNGGFEDYRGIYINRILEGLNNAQKEDLMNLQLDPYSLKAEEGLPILLEHLNPDKLSTKENEIVEVLKAWDYRYTADSKAASYFQKWWSNFYNLTYDEIFKKREKLNIPLPEEFRLIEMMEDEKEHPIFDVEGTTKKEVLSDLVNESFQSIGFDTLDLEVWSQERNTEINHLTSMPAFSRKITQSGGHGNTPNAISKFNGPSWRMIVELDDPVKAYGIYPGGQSGNPGSPFYDNFIDDWDNGKYYELNNARDPKDIKTLYSIKIRKK